MRRLAAGITLNPPLCGATAGQQVRGKANPAIRPLRVARGLGQRGIVASVCASSFDDTMKRLGKRLAPRLAK